MKIILLPSPIEKIFFFMSSTEFAHNQSKLVVLKWSVAWGRQGTSPAPAASQGQIFAKSWKANGLKGLKRLKTTRENDAGVKHRERHLVLPYHVVKVQQFCCNEWVCPQGKKALKIGLKISWRCKPKYLKKWEVQLSCNWDIWSPVGCVLSATLLLLDHKGSLRHLFTLHLHLDNVFQAMFSDSAGLNHKRGHLASRAGHWDGLDLLWWSAGRPQRQMSS